MVEYIRAKAKSAVSDPGICRVDYPVDSFPHITSAMAVLLPGIIVHMILKNLIVAAFGVFVPSSLIICCTVYCI